MNRAGTDCAGTLIAKSRFMISTLRASSAAFTASIFVFAAACGGTSVSHVDAGGMAGMSESGGSGTTGGSSGHGGSGATGGTRGSSGGTTSTGGTGGTGATGGFGNSGSTGAFGGTGALGGTGAFGGTGALGGSGAFGGTGALGGAGGTAGHSGGGTGGISGGGGSGGSTPCVYGGMCTTEGATCSESACCSCSHTCKGGVWSAGICPPCAAPICPQDPPRMGDMCSVCSIPQGGCSWDERGFDGPLYEADCVNGRWAVSTLDAHGCCSMDSDCSGGSCVQGVCKTPPSTGCWTERDCVNGGLCQGADVCTCGAECFAADSPGNCVYPL